MKTSNVELNLAALNDILAESPATTHVYLRRSDGVMIDIPLAHAEFTIRQHPDWMVEGGAVPQIELAVRPAADPNAGELPLLPSIPMKPSEAARKYAEQTDKAAFEGFSLTPIPSYPGDAAQVTIPAEASSGTISLTPEKPKRKRKKKNG